MTATASSSGVSRLSEADGSSEPASSTQTEASHTSASASSLAATPPSTRVVDVGGGMTVQVHGAAPVPVGIDASTTADGDDSMTGVAATTHQPNVSTDDPMMGASSTPARLAGAQPSLRALLQRPAEDRRDRTPAPAPVRVVLPRPSAAAIEAIDALYANGGDWTSLVSSIEQARPYELPRARFVMTIDTGRAFERMGINKIMASFLKDNGNPVVQEQIKLQQLGQISKGRGGELRVKVKTRAACERLAQQEVKILGNKFVFQDFDILADRFYIDISSVDSNFDNEGMLKRFYELGTEPIYDTFRDVNLAAGMTTATWRVYFRSVHCPVPLKMQGKVCDQLLFEGRVYPAQARDAPFPSQRLGFGQRSAHALDLNTPSTPSSTKTTVNAPQQSTSPRTFADVVTARADTSTNASAAGQAQSKTRVGDDSSSVISLGTNMGSLLHHLEALGAATDRRRLNRVLQHRRQRLSLHRVANARVSARVTRTTLRTCCRKHVRSQWTALSRPTTSTC